jgi:hypothetical protein
VPVNFWSRNSDDEKLVIDDEFEDLEGWKGDSGIGETSLGIGMIPLGGVEERTIRHVARIASEVLRDVETLIQVSPQVRHVAQYSLADIRHDESARRKDERLGSNDTWYDPGERRIPITSWVSRLPEECNNKREQRHMS